MPGDVSVNIGCNYEDFLKGLATVKKEADLAVLEQRKKDQAARDERRAAAKAERDERKKAEREKQDAQRKENKDAATAWRETQRQLREKEKIEKDAQDAAATRKQQKIGIAQGFISGGVTGGISAIGAALGPEGQLAAEAINMVVEAFKKLVDEAKQLRNLSYATDISTGELRKMQVVAEQSGVSLSQFAHAVSEFNKNMGKARIAGSELNGLLSKLGVSQDDVKNGTYDYNKAIRDLSKAHRAGTDAATLAYYGNIMFGSSFEQLLPIIKKGTGEFDRSMYGIYKTTELATSQLAETSNRWEKFWANFKNVGAEGFAYLDIYINRFTEAFVIGATRAIATQSPRSAAKFFNRESTLGSEGRLIAGKAFAKTMSEKDGKEFLDELNKQIKGEAGTKLTPLGLSTAQGASSLQQMGGGDIISAIAFTPLERIASATEQTAANTDPKNKQGVIEATPVRSPIGY